MKTTTELKLFSDLLGIFLGGATGSAAVIALKMKARVDEELAKGGEDE